MEHRRFHNQAGRAFTGSRAACRVSDPRRAFYLSLTAALWRRQRAGLFTLLAIDGRCGSGKTLLAAYLEELFGCSTLHLDDFFLPEALRTPARLATPGGNVDAERFLHEVLLPLRNGLPPSVRPYCCRQGGFGPARALPPQRLWVIEGSYALHPLLRRSYDLRVFLTCPESVQIDRLARRGGPAMLERFLTEWIPLEERYFAVTRPVDWCGWQFDTSLLRLPPK